MVDDRQFSEWAEAEGPRILQTLIDLVNIDTTTPNEWRAYPYLMEYLGGIGLNPRLEPFPDGIAGHPSYSSSVLLAAGTERCNIRGGLEPPEAGRKVVFNTHFDVVPATPEFKSAFHGHVKDGFVHGRGSSDSKGSLIMFCEAIRFLLSRGIPIRKRIGIDLVSEEEIGGNGTLACILNGVEADEIVVVEGTELQVYCGHRGCLTFSVKAIGKPVHMGAYATGVSSIDCAFKIIQRLRELEARFMAEAKTDPYFDIWEGLTPVLIGQIQGGEWPGSVPENCRITGNIGFLPRYTIEQIKQMLVEKIDTMGDPWIPEHYEISYPGLKNEAYLTDRGERVVEELLRAARRCGTGQERAYGWKVSCDARLYSRLLNIPTVIFGCGSLKYAHSNAERIAIDDLFAGMKIVANYLTT